MLINVLVGFIIPWIFGIYLFKLKPNILLTIFPIGTVLSHIINSLATEYKLWYISPEKFAAIDYLLFDIGLYTILPSYLIFFIQKYSRINKYFFILLFTIITTISEFIWLKAGRVSYDNNWTIYHTFFSYLIPYILVYMYYKLLKKKGVIV